MNDPPDLEPGGSGLCLDPPVASYVTISDDLSGMDTDVSQVSTSKSEGTRKRVRHQPRSVCKHCNKRRKKKRNSTDSSDTTQCQCIITSNDVVEEPHIHISGSGSQPLIETRHQSSVDNVTAKIPQPSLGRKEYLASDLQPYVVHVQKIEASSNTSTTLHPMAFGNFLKKNKFQYIIPGSVKRIGRNRCAVAFTTHSAANDFIGNKNLSTYNFKAFIPTFSVTRMGLIRGIPNDWSVEEIIENVSVPVGCGKVLKVRRLNYKVTTTESTTWKPSQSVVLTFDGQVLPKRVFVCFNSVPVDIYTFPTIQCYKCCRYGHTKALCRSVPRCFKCSQNHTGDSCSVEDDAAVCIMCNGFHFATSKVCPEFNRQKEIKHTMAHNCISYMEACKLHPPVSKSYANALSTPVKPASHNKNASPSSSNANPVSYNKTVFLKPRSLPKFSKGFDCAAHNAIIKEGQIPTPANGCGLKAKSDDDGNLKHSQILNLILSILGALLHSNSNILKPSDVATLNEFLKQTVDINNGLPNYSVELSEYST